MYLSHHFEETFPSRAVLWGCKQVGFPLEQGQHKAGFLISGGGGLVAKSCRILDIPRIVARQALLSVGFSRQEHWGGLPFPSPN